MHPSLELHPPTPRRRRIPRAGLAILALALLAASAGTAAAKQVRYIGAHPIDAHGHYCHIGVAHVHVFAPARNDVRYRVHGGAYLFVGDPVAHGYDGPHTTYVGPHPIDVDVAVVGLAPDSDVEYCYLEGPHYHAWAPEGDASFVVSADAQWYVGTLPPRYREDRRRYVGINAFYAPIVYARPVVTVSPPVGWVGVGVGVDAHVVAPAVEVEASAPVVRAGLEVHVPVPTIEVGFGIGGGVVVEEHRHVHRDVVVHDHRHGGWGKPKKWKRGKHGRGHDHD